MSAFGCMWKAPVIGVKQQYTSGSHQSVPSSQQAGLIEANGELKVFIDQNLSPGKGKEYDRLYC